MAEAPHIERHDTTRPVISTIEARQGVRRQGVFYVLAISLLLVVVAFTAVYFW